MTTPPLPSRRPARRSRSRAPDPVSKGIDVWVANWTASPGARARKLRQPVECERQRHDALLVADRDREDRVRLGPEQQPERDLRHERGERLQPDAVHERSEDGSAACLGTLADAADRLLERPRGRRGRIRHLHHGERERQLADSPRSDPGARTPSPTGSIRSGSSSPVPRSAAGGS